MAYRGTCSVIGCPGLRTRLQPPSMSAIQEGEDTFDMLPYVTSLAGVPAAVLTQPNMSSLIIECRTVAKCFTFTPTRRTIQETGHVGWVDQNALESRLQKKTDLVLSGVCRVLLTASVMYSTVEHWYQIRYQANNNWVLVTMESIYSIFCLYITRYTL